MIKKRKKLQKTPFYRLDNILTYGAQYNIIIGQRSNGKSYAVLEYGLEHYWQQGGKMAIIRRWADDLKGKNGGRVFDGLVSTNRVTEITGGEWTYVHYWAGRWYLARDTEDGKRETQKDPFAYAFALTQMEHDKSAAYPDVDTILFDEFIPPAGYYLPDEFVILMNVLSTIIRHRDNVQIFMVANAISQNSPYFREMGITKIKDMAPGEIELYTYGNSGLKVAVEFSDYKADGKPSDIYFAFDNPKLDMITGRGEIWQLDIHPHAPEKIRPDNIIYSYIVDYYGEMMQGDIISGDSGNTYIYIHAKTSPIKYPDNDLIYSTGFDPRPNWRRNILKPIFEVEKKILYLHRADKVYYQDNEVGELYHQYLHDCQNGNL